MSSKSREIYFFSMRLGLQALLKGKYKVGVKRLLYPVPYWRYPVFPILLDTLDAERNKGRKKVVDIGSPKLPALFLALKRGLDTYATDLQDRDIFNIWEPCYNCYSSRNSTGKYITEYQDGRALTYSDESFDFVYSLSVLEHIPNDGDTVAVKEIARVLKRNGIAVIEVPYDIRHRDVFFNRDVYGRKFSGEPVFFERYYDEASVKQRLLFPSGLKLEKRVVIAERIRFHDFWEKVPRILRVPLLWSEAVISALNHYEIGAKQLAAYKTAGKDTPMSITLVLRKT